MMFRPILTLMPLAIIIIANSMLPITAQASTTECKGSLGRITVHSIQIPQGYTCILRSTTVQGDIIVNSGATLKAVSVRVSGSIQVTGVALIDIDNASIIQGGIIKN